jgi:hypothetical protein
MLQIRLFGLEPVARKPRHKGTAHEEVRLRHVWNLLPQPGGSGQTGKETGAAQSPSRLGARLWAFSGHDATLDCLERLGEDGDNANASPDCIARELISKSMRNSS